jgi:hypothetical protein
MNMQAGDFFISYSQVDRKWAEWIAWSLEEAGFTTRIADRDFAPGTNFVLEMERALQESERTIIILSAAYIESAFTQAEWLAAFARDPTGKEGKLVPIRVEPVHLSGLLASLITVDLFGKSESEAREALLFAVSRGRSKPRAVPAFPTQHKAVTAEPLVYPGSALNDPPELLPYVNQFRSDHPDPRKNAFLIMRFGLSPRHHRIHEAINSTFLAHEIRAHRADDKAYTDLLLQNIRTYMHGCGFGVAVFERIESDNHNPNVALEVGYMLALGKRVCLLKDKTLSRLPTDIVGSLYAEFDMDDIETSIRSTLERWLRQRGIIDA